MKHTHSFITALAILAMVIAPAIAEDFAPPYWAGGPLSVWADWDYPNSSPPADLNDPADAWGNAGTGPNGETLSQAVQYQGIVQPVALVESNSDFQAGPDGWQSTTNNATLHYNLPNYVDNEPFKWVRVELTYLDPQSTGKMPFVRWIEFFDPTIPGNMDSFDPIEGQAQTTIWTQAIPPTKQLYEDWILQPNPDWEIISVAIPAGIVLQETFIHTISIPEPATMSLLALAGLGLLRRRNG